MPPQSLVDTMTRLWKIVNPEALELKILATVCVSGSLKYVPTFEPTLHQDFQLWLC